MLDKDPVDIWCVYNIYFFLAYSSHGGKVSITGYTNFPKNKLHDALGQNKEELKKIKKWSGYNLPDGLWDDLCYADLALERRYPGCGIMFHKVEEGQ